MEFPPKTLSSIIRLLRGTQVLTKILQQGTEFDTLAETVLADRFEQLVQLVTMIGDKGNYSFFYTYYVPLVTVVTPQQNIP